jgi:hypothetical protein
MGILTVFEGVGVSGEDIEMTMPCPVQLGEEVEIYSKRGYLKFKVESVVWLLAPGDEFNDQSVQMIVKVV